MPWQTVVIKITEKPTPKKGFQPYSLQTGDMDLYSDTPTLNAVSAQVLFQLLGYVKHYNQKKKFGK